MRRTLYILGGLVILALFLNLGGASLWDIDEGVYGDISREMAENTDFAVPYWNYAPKYDKPPLTFWISAFFIKVFGPTELAVRLASTLFGVGGILITFIAGRQLFTERVGLASGLILGTSIIWFIESRMGLVDTALSFFIALSMYAAWRVIQDDEPKYFLLLWATAAFGVLVKGPIAVVLPGGAIFFWLGWRKSLQQLTRPWFWAGVALFAVLALPWHLAIWQKEGMAWINSYFGYHMFTRFTQPIEEHGQPFFYYIIVTLVGFAPWSPLFWSIGRDVVSRFREGPKRFVATPAVKLLFWWFATIFIFFSIAQTKLPGYIIPTFIPLSILVAYWLEKVKEHQGTKRLLAEYVLTAGIIAAISVAALVALRSQVPPEYLNAYKMILNFPILMLIGALAVWLVGRKLDDHNSILVVVVMVAIVSSVMYSFVVQPMTEDFKPVKPLALTAEKLATDQHEIVSMLGDASTPFYVKRRVLYASSNERVLEIIAENPEKSLLLMVPLKTGEYLINMYEVEKIQQHPMGMLLELRR